MLKKLKVNFFGEGLKRSLVGFPTDSIEALKECLQKEESVNVFVADETILGQKLLTELEVSPLTTVFNGMLYSSRHQIEIWFAGKKIAKFNIAELNAEYLLFPLYH